MNDTTKRFARTLNEAFGPYTSRRIEDDDEPLDRGELAVVWGCAVVALAVTVCIALGVI
jgi:hypothetical protein